MAHVNKDFKEFKCDLCDFSSHAWKYVKTHKLNCHETESHTLSCEKCGRRFAFPSQLKKVNLHNYFNLHVCPSISCLSLGVPQSDVTDKSCLVCVKSEKFASLVTLRPQWDCCSRGEAKVHILDFKTTWSEFQMPSQTAPAEANTQF